MMATCEVNIADEKFSNNSCICFSLFRCLFLLVILGNQETKSIYKKRKGRGGMKTERNLEIVF